MKRDRRQPPPPPRHCELDSCGIEFQPSSSNQRFCCTVHTNIAHNLARAQRREYTRQCKNCGVVFETDKSVQVFHSQGCQREADAHNRRVQKLRVKPFWPNADRSITIPRAPDGEKAMYVSDAQMPFHDVPLWAIIEDFMGDYKPDKLFYVGDMLDLWSWSGFGNPPTEGDVTDELDVCREMLSRHRKIVGPDCETFFTLGNHEERASRITNFRPEFRAYVARRLPEEMGLTDNSIRYLDWGGWVNYLGVTITHGEFVSNALYGAANAARRNITKFGGSGISGHTHRRACVAFSSVRGTHTWYDLGCTTRMDQPWKRGKSDWEWGIATSIVFDNQVHVQQIPIHEHGFASPAGKFYRR